MDDAMCCDGERVNVVVGYGYVDGMKKEEE